MNYSMQILRQADFEKKLDNWQVLEIEEEEVAEESSSEHKEYRMYYNAAKRRRQKQILSEKLNRLPVEVKNLKLQENTFKRHMNTQKKSTISRRKQGQKFRLKS